VLPDGKLEYVDMEDDVSVTDSLIIDSVQDFEAEISAVSPELNGIGINEDDEVVVVVVAAAVVVVVNNIADEEAEGNDTLIDWGLVMLEE
jgi:hypothetical protein